MFSSPIAGQCAAESTLGRSPSQPGCVCGGCVHKGKSERERQMLKADYSIRSREARKHLRVV